MANKTLETRFEGNYIVKECLSMASKNLESHLRGHGIMNSWLYQCVEVCLSMASETLESHLQCRHTVNLCLSMASKTLNSP